MFAGMNCPDRVMLPIAATRAARAVLRSFVRVSSAAVAKTKKTCRTLKSFPPLSTEKPDTMGFCSRHDTANDEKKQRTRSFVFEIDELKKSELWDDLRGP